MFPQLLISLLRVLSHVYVPVYATQYMQLANLQLLDVKLKCINYTLA